MVADCVRVRVGVRVSARARAQRQLQLRRQGKGRQDGRRGWRLRRRCLGRGRARGGAAGVLHLGVGPPHDDADGGGHLRAARFPGLASGARAPAPSAWPTPARSIRERLRPASGRGDCAGRWATRRCGSGLRGRLGRCTRRGGHWSASQLQSGSAPRRSKPCRAPCRRWEDAHRFQANVPGDLLVERAPKLVEATASTTRRTARRFLASFESPSMRSRTPSCSVSVSTRACALASSPRAACGRRLPPPSGGAGAARASSPGRRH